MAVDYSVPLITDIKCAKLLVEAIQKTKVWMAYVYLTDYLEDSQLINFSVCLNVQNMITWRDLEFPPAVLLL